MSIPDQQEISAVRDTFRAVGEQADTALKLLDSCVLSRKEAETSLVDMQNRLVEVLRERDDWRIRADMAERQLYDNRNKRDIIFTELKLLWQLICAAIFMGTIVFTVAVLAEFTN